MMMGCWDGIESEGRHCCWWCDGRLRFLLLKECAMAEGIFFRSEEEWDEMVEGVFMVE